MEALNHFSVANSCSQRQPESPYSGCKQLGKNPVTTCNAFVQYNDHPAGTGKPLWRFMTSSSKVAAQKAWHSLEHSKPLPPPDISTAVWSAPPPGPSQPS